MSHFPQYTTNSSNNDTNQFTMQGLDANVMKSLFENSGNVLTQNINPQDISYMQQNKIPGQYIIHLPNNGVPMQQPFMQVMPFPYGNFYYVNQPSQFPTAEAGVQYNGAPVLPIQLSNGVMQMDINDLRKLQNTAQTPNGARSRKRSYSNQIKQELSDTLQPNGNDDEVQRDNRNRPLLYSCPDCSRKFSMQSRLTQHKKCHLGIRPFACSSCNLAFTQKSYLVRHAAVHKDERPYTCALCQKTYKHYGSLANHRKTHKNGAKPTDPSGAADVSKPATCKGEEIVDLNNNSTATKAFIGGGNAEFLFQAVQGGVNSAQEPQQQPGSDQSYSTAPFSSGGDLFSSSFHSQISAAAAGLPTDINPSFISQLNFHNGNFYSLSFDPTDVKRELAPLEPISDENNSTSRSINNNSSSSSISVESQPINLT